MADGGGRQLWRPGESKFAPALGQAICARVEAGEAIAAICREPQMPCRNTVRAWTRAHPEFGAKLLAAMRAVRTAARLEDRRIWGKLDAERHPRGRGSTYRREIGETICLRLAHGESLTSIGRDPAMPTYATILRWVSRHDDFQEMYVQARKLQADYFFDEARDVAQAATPGNVWVSRLQFDVIRWQTARLAPHKYCETLVVEAGRKAEAGDGRLTINVVRFEKGPNGEVLAIPPRNAEDERRWAAAHGRPYDGPR